MTCSVCAYVGLPHRFQENNQVLFGCTAELFWLPIFACSKFTLDRNRFAFRAFHLLSYLRARAQKFCLFPSLAMWVSSPLPRYMSTADSLIPLDDPLLTKWACPCCPQLSGFGYSYAEDGTLLESLKVKLAGCCASVDEGYLEMYLLLRCCHLPQSLSWMVLSHRTSAWRCRLWDRCCPAPEYNVDLLETVHWSYLQEGLWYGDSHRLFVPTVLLEKGRKITRYLCYSIITVRTSFVSRSPTAFVEKSTCFSWSRMMETQNQMHFFSIFALLISSSPARRPLRLLWSIPPWHSGPSAFRGAINYHNGFSV